MSLNHLKSWKFAVRESATYWFENQRASRIISRTPMEVAVRKIAMYWFKNQIATYWFENQRASRIISQTPMEVVVQEIATYWFENQQASRMISRTPMKVLELVYYMCISCGQHDSHTQLIEYPGIRSQSCRVIKQTTFARNYPLTTFYRVVQPWPVLWDRWSVFIGRLGTTTLHLSRSFLIMRCTWPQPTRVLNCSWKIFSRRQDI